MAGIWGVYSESCQFSSSIDGEMELVTAPMPLGRSQKPYSFYIVGGLSLMDASLAKKKD